MFKVIRLPKNVGHGEARRISLKNCSHELIALMDADDLSLPCRFEIQLELFDKDPGLDIVGGQITEFLGAPENITGLRQVPLTDPGIKENLKKRCPMNQVTVMFRKSAVLEVGGYIDWYCEEDYYLWIRMVQAGKRFANTDRVLVNVRTGEKMSARRGGWKYFCSEAGIQRLMLSDRMISLPRYLYNMGLRFGGEVLLPNFLRKRVFRMMRRPYYPVQDSQQEVPKEKKSHPPFSVVMCVYAGDCAEWFRTAVESILQQTVKPSEVVLVVDGPVPKEMEAVMEELSKNK